MKSMNLEAQKTEPRKFDFLCAACVLMGSIGNAMAEPGGMGPDPGPDRARVEQRLDNNKQLGLRQAENKMLEERRRAALNNMMDSRNDPGKRARLTPDERRDLRRHINQAGQDIYANLPKD